jgi:hypothetical protein
MIDKLDGVYFGLYFGGGELKDCTRSRELATAANFPACVFGEAVNFYLSVKHC